ncbi:MAG: NB-ARC domain-containing protein, partial [Calditrichota bacterium]
MEPITTSFTLASVYALAKKSGLADFILDQPKKTVERLLQEKLSGRVKGSKYLKAYFTPQVEDAFEYAFEPYADGNSSIHRRFLVKFLTDPAISKSLENMESGITPEPAVLQPVLNSLFEHHDNVPRAEDVIQRLYEKLSGNQKIVNQVSLHLPEMVRENKVYLQEILKQVETIAANLTPVEKQKIFAVPEVPPNFVGRKQLIEELKKRLLHGGDVAPLTGGKATGVYGMTGVGKTYLALYFAHLPEVAEKFDGIVHQFCGDQPLETIVPELGNSLGLKKLGEQPPDKALAALKQHLLQGSYLLILDDVVKQPIEQLLPGGNVSVIITTRRKDLKVLALHPPLDVEVFTKAESMELFSSILSEALIGHENEAAKIADTLGHLPIAIAVAAGLLRDSARWTFPKMLELLEIDRPKGLSKLKHRDRNVELLLINALNALTTQQLNLMSAMAACAEEGF